ncbi:MAG: 5-oxoprolinase subunit PxpB [Pyrinomonadaceae bacterium]
MLDNPRYFSVSEYALTVDFENVVSEKLNQKILDLADNIKSNQFAGFIELVPAFSSLTVFFDPVIVRKNSLSSLTAFQTVKDFIEKISKKTNESQKSNSREMEIIFDTSDKFALDLEYISRTKNLSKSEIVEIFTSKIYRVFMLGFLPGFPYMGEVDERIAVPRKQSPRLKVPQGSVGIAGNQTGIYPLESPGGWQIIGRTETELFTSNEKNPVFFQAGDLVKFIAK